MAARRSSTLGPAHSSALRTNERAAGPAAYPVTLTKLRGYLAIRAATIGIPIEGLQRLVRRLDADPAPAAQQLAAMVVLTVGWQLRGVEHSRARLGDAALEADLAVLGCVGAKNAKVTHASQTRAAGHVGARYKELCPVRRLTAWLASNAGRAAASPLFRAPAKDGTLTANPWKGDAYRKAVGEALRQEGVDHEKLSAHWARKTGYNVWSLELGRKSGVTDLAGGRNAKDVGAVQRKHYQAPSPKAG